MPSGTATAERIFRLPFERSHDTSTVAAVVTDILARHPGEEFVLLPNNGTVPLLACLRALHEAPDLQRRVRILATVHSDHADAYSLLIEHERHIAHFIGVSRHIAERLAAALPHRADAVTCLPYPVHLPAMAAAPASGTPLRLIYAGRLDEAQKRVSRLPAVTAALMRRGIPFGLDIYGDGPARGALEEAFDNLPPAPRQQIRLHGAIDTSTLQARLPNHDVALLVSAYEGTPIALLESMAAGLCPVVMDIDSGIPELIRDGVDGCRVPQGDTEGMAAALARLHHDRTLLRRLGAQARRRIADEYSIDRHLDALGHVLHACFDRPPAAADEVSSPFECAIQQTLAEARLDAPTAIWGGGMYGRSLADACLRAGLQPAAIIDSDPEKQGWHYRGIPYLPPAWLPQSDTAQVLIGSLAFAGEIAQQIRALSARSGRPCPRLPGAGDNSA